MIIKNATSNFCNKIQKAVKADNDFGVGMYITTTESADVYSDDEKEHQHLKYKVELHYDEYHGIDDVKVTLHKDYKLGEENHEDTIDALVSEVYNTNCDIKSNRSSRSKSSSRSNRSSSSSSSYRSNGSYPLIRFPKPSTPEHVREMMSDKWTKDMQATRRATPPKGKISNKLDLPKKKKGIMHTIRRFFKRK